MTVRELKLGGVEQAREPNQPKSEHMPDITNDLKSLDMADIPEMDVEALHELEGFEVHSPEASATFNNTLTLSDDRRHDRRPVNRRLLDAQQIQTMTKTISPLPADGETCHIIIAGKASLWDVVPATLALITPATIATLWTATLGFSTRNNNELCELLDTGDIGRVHFMCSHYFRRTSEYLYTPMEQNLTARGQRFLATNNHAKLLLIATTDGRHFVAESSANLRSCRNTEILILTHDLALFNFHTQWMNELFEEAAHGRQTT